MFSSLPRRYDRPIGSLSKSRLASTAVAGLLVVGLSGCSFYDSVPVGGSSGGKGRAKSINISTAFTQTGTVQPGTVFAPGPTPTSVVITGQVSKGTFSATLPFKVNPNLPKKKKKAGAAGGGISSVSGSVVSRISGTYDFVAGTGTFTGVQVLRFNQAKLGDACLTFTSTASNFAKNETGEFILAGGTKLAARTRATGSYTASKPAQGPTATVSGTLTLTGKIGKPAKGLTPACSALAGQL